MLTACSLPNHSPLPRYPCPSCPSLLIGVHLMSLPYLSGFPQKQVTSPSLGSPGCCCPSLPPCPCSGLCPTMCPCLRLLFPVLHRPVDHPPSRADLAYPLLCLHGQGKPSGRGSVWNFIALGVVSKWSKAEGNGTGRTGKAQMEGLVGQHGEGEFGMLITLCSLRKLSPLNCPRMYGLPLAQ